MLRKILLVACSAIAASWLAWSIFTHLAGAFVKPELVTVDANALISRKLKDTTLPGYVADTSDATFNRDVLNAQQPVFVEFYATWCGPCQIMAPVVEDLSAHYKGSMRFFRVDIDRNPELVGKYQVQSIPSLKMFYRGEVVDGALGVTDQPVLREKIDRVITLGGANSR